MPVDNVAQGQRAGFAADIHRLQFPGVEGFRRYRGARPDQVHEDHAAFGCQPQPQLADFIMVLQARGEKGDGLDQCEAVDPRPQAGILFLVLDRQMQLVLDAAGRGGQNIDCQHVLQRPARLQRIGKAVHGVVELAAHCRSLVGNHAHEALADVRLHLR
jgi:hypothetical protein